MEFLRITCEEEGYESVTKKPMYLYSYYYYITFELCIRIDQILITDDIMMRRRGSDGGHDIMTMEITIN